MSASDVEDDDDHRDHRGHGHGHHEVVSDRDSDDSDKDRGAKRPTLAVDKANNNKQQGSTSVAAAGAMDAAAPGADGSQLGSVYGIIGNIQALLKMAVENANKQQQVETSNKGKQSRHCVIREAFHLRQCSYAMLLISASPSLVDKSEKDPESSSLQREVRVVFHPPTRMP
jgi:hypothetical protein